jgi:hypothetical protein
LKIVSGDFGEMVSKQSLLTIVQLVNGRNRTSVCAAECRQGWNSLLEELLEQAGDYNGFAILTAAEVPQGQQPGHLDSSRRAYKLSPRLERLAKKGSK